MSRYAVLSTDEFGRDLDSAVAYYLEASGQKSATQLLDEYDKMRDYLAELPGYGANVHGLPYRWRPLKSFVAVYAVDEAAETVTLIRLFHMRSNWKAHLLDSAPS